MKQMFGPETGALELSNLQVLESSRFDARARNFERLQDRKPALLHWAGLERADVDAVAERTASPPVAG